MRSDGRRHAAWAGPAVGSLVVGLYLGHIVYFWPQINDDTFITLRYSKFLALGLGPYFNPGEHVEGYTNPLLMWIMAAVLRFIDDAYALVVAKLIGALAGVGSLIFAWLLARRWLQEVRWAAPHAALAAWAGPALLATQAGYALNSTTGLETTLFGLSIVLGLLLGQYGEDADRWRGAGVAFALATWIRPEGAAVFGVTLLARLLAGAWSDPNTRRRWLLDISVAFVAVSGLLALRFALYDGHLLPNTYHAKLGGMLGQSTASAYLAGFASHHLAWIGGIPALVVPFVVRGRLRRLVVPALAVLVFGLLATYVTGPGWMPGYRLLAPYLPVWAVLSSLGLLLVCDRFSRRRLTAYAVLSGLLVAGLFVWQWPVRTRYHENALTRAAGYRNGHQALADWLCGKEPVDKTVGLMDIGIVGFRCVDLRILDLTGLTDRTIAMSPGGFLRKQFPLSYVLDRRPDYLVIVMTGPAEIRRGQPLRLVPWTEIERRLLDDPVFRERYVQPRAVDPRSGLLLQLAAQYGATRVFRHDYPGRSYFLFVFSLVESVPRGAHSTEQRPGVDSAR